MSGLGKATAATAMAVGILVLIPVVGYVWNPMRTEEMMGGRLMVWGVAWGAIAASATAALTVLCAIGLWRRIRQR